MRDGPQPARYFEKSTGLLARKLADDVRTARWTMLTDSRSQFHPVDVKPYELGPYHRQLYSYEDGLWSPRGEVVAQERIVELLGDSYRPGHARAVLDTIMYGPDVLGEMPDPYVINCRNGYLHWDRPGPPELYEHSPATPSRTQINVPYVEEARCPRILSWLREVVADDCIDLVFEIIGYCLLDANPLHKAVLIIGPGGNGKSTLLSLIRALVGQRNVCAVPPQALDGDRFAAADLHEKLANLVGDVSPKAFTTTENFKKATGEDMLRAERKYGQPFEFRNNATIVAAFNELPTSSDTSEGFFRRWVVLPMDRFRAADTKPNPRLLEELTAPGELAGLLAHSVLGLRMAMSRRQFSAPPTVVEAKEQFETYANPARAFLEEHAANVLGSTGEWWGQRKVLYTAYQTWCSDNGLGALGNRRFYSQVASLRIPGVSISEAKREGYIGYKLTAI